ncbi:MAG: thioesterase family protein [Pseudomonadota bacterium]
MSDARSERDWTRDGFPLRRRLETRWSDNDRYGHVNNAVYYTLFEQVMMGFLEETAALDLDALGLRCYTVENGCRYHDALVHPCVVEAGLRVARVGRSSVRYELALFAEGDPAVRATGHVVDVFVDSQTERPSELPDAVRQALAPLTEYTDA